jgi:hypothetical protein
MGAAMKRLMLSALVLCAATSLGACQHRRHFPGGGFGPPPAPAPPMPTPTPAPRPPG